MKTKSLTIILTLLLTACSGIPYNANESHAKIASDLKIKEQDIEIISKCNFYPFEYGVKVYAKMRSCLFIKESNNLIFVGYDSSTKKYNSAFKVSLQEVHCAAIADQDPGKGIVYLYTAKNAFTVALLHSNNDLNHEAVNDLEKELTNKSIPTFDLSISVTNPLYRYKSSARSVCPLTMRIWTLPTSSEESFFRSCRQRGCNRISGLAWASARAIL